MAHVTRITLTIVSLFLLAVLIFQGFAPIVQTSTGPLALGLHQIWSYAADVPGAASRASAFAHILSKMDLSFGFAVRGIVYGILAALTVLSIWRSETAVSRSIDWALTAKMKSPPTIVKAVTIAAVAFPMLFAWKLIGYSLVENREGLEKSLGVSRPDLEKRFRELNDPTMQF